MVKLVFKRPLLTICPAGGKQAWSQEQRPVADSPARRFSKFRVLSMFVQGHWSAASVDGGGRVRKV
jgi:hypothetical protein